MFNGETDTGTLRPYFFNTWFTDFFFQNIKVGGGKKYYFFFLLNLKHIWIGEKKNNINCMILHCKNAEMTIIVISAFLQCKIIQILLLFFLSFLHFYSVKSYNFVIFF